jgi:hypothetical protein
VVALACQKPRDLGYAQELWTTQLLAKHVRRHCEAVGHASLAKLGRGTVSKILSAHQVQPHKIQYYLERRDPEFDMKMVQVLHVYKEVEMWRDKGAPRPDLVAVLSYDEKPGIQALDNTAPDLPPIPGKHSTMGRDHEYVRHGTLSLLAGIDLLSGEVLGLVRKRHRSAEFIEFLKLVRCALPGGRTYPSRARQSLRPHLQRDAVFFGQAAKPVRIHLHTRTRILAQPDRIVLQQDGTDPAARHSRRLSRRTESRDRTLPQGDQ